MTGPDMQTRLEHSVNSMSWKCWHLALLPTRLSDVLWGRKKQTESKQKLIQISWVPPMARAASRGFASKMFFERPPCPSPQPAVMQSFRTDGQNCVQMGGQSPATHRILDVTPAAWPRDAAPPPAFKNNRWGSAQNLSMTVIFNRMFWHFFKLLLDAFNCSNT